MADKEWVAESIVQFSRSPMWSGPVNDFIDEKCGIFDDDDEMKLEYTVVHREFHKLLDRLLTDFVNELGIPLETALEAVRACAATQRGRPMEAAMGRLLKYVFSMDDFACFHAMMVKRNVELDMLAYGALRSQGLVPDEPYPQPQHADGAVPDDRVQLVRAANGEVDEEQAFDLAIQASLREKDMEAKRDELEAAQLREAMALDAQLNHAVSHAKPDVEVPPTRPTPVAVPQGRQQPAERALTAAPSGVVAPIVATESVPETTTPPPAAVVVSETTQPTVPSGNKRTAVLPPIDSAPIATAPPSGVTTHGASKAAATAGGRSAPVRPTPPSTAPSKEELEARANHMRELREQIVAHNKAKRREEMNEYAGQNNVSIPSAPDARRVAERQLTVDIARRLRDDIVEEARKS